MQTVFRIEHASNGEGMYRGMHDGLSGVMFRTGTDADYDRHPTPWEDSGLMQVIADSGADRSAVINSGDFRYGFGSVDQLRAWLYRNEWLEGLHDSGYIVAICEAETAYVGHSQALFIRPEEYRKVSIKEFFKLKDKECSTQTTSTSYD